MSVTVVAELSINHGGDVDVALEMIRAAHDCGCDAVKLQTYRAEDFLPQGHEDFEMFKRAEIWPHLDTLVRYAHDVGIQIGTTPTSIEGVGEAVGAGADFLKNGSDFMLRTDLIEAMLATGLPVWVSTGMATAEEISRVMHRFRDAYFMACTSLYPCPDEHAELWRVGRMIGYSDHTTGTTAGVMAVARGAKMFEFHFTLERGMGADGDFARTPSETLLLVREIRRAEVMLGGSWTLSPAELEGREKWRVREGQLRG